MSRWTDRQKEMQGYRRKMANGMKVSLADAPWDKKEEEDDRSRRETEDHGTSDTKGD